MEHFHKKIKTLENETSYSKKKKAFIGRKTAQFPLDSGTSGLFSEIPPESVQILQTFDSLVQDVRPLTGRQQRELPFLIRELSHQMTDQRGERRRGYINETPFLSAYIRYFMWWNLYRLTALFAAFPGEYFSTLEKNAVLLDIGSGPLTVPAALWLARPELRSKKITLYCVDHSPSILAAGEDLFLSIAAKTAFKTKNSAQPQKKNSEQKPENMQTFSEKSQNTEEMEDQDGNFSWKIIRVKGDIGVSIKEKAAFITCANMFNELHIEKEQESRNKTVKYGKTLLSYGLPEATYFVAEPGVPYAARFIALLRDEFLKNKVHILSPCPHEKSCPMDGFRGGKWCHFTLDTKSAPPALKTLSDQAGLPKDRATISFVLARSGTENPKKAKAETLSKNENQVKNIGLRVISDPIKLPEGTGRYACSQLGLTLLTGRVRQIPSGTLIEYPFNPERKDFLPRDRKSGAVILKKD